MLFIPIFIQVPKTNNCTLCVCVTLELKCYLLGDVAKSFGHLAYTYLTAEP